MYQERSPQKTIPMAGHRTRMAKNRPDTLSVSMLTLPKLTTESSGKLPPTNGNVEVQKVARDGGHGREITVFKLSPLVKKPLTPVFENKKGGHTTGGGGTSPEALRRAKRKKRNLP